MSASRVPVIIGEVLFDRFKDGTSVLGGAPFNVAWHLHAFGCEPLFISRIGRDDDGEQILERMAAWGMATRGVQQDPHLSTGEVIVEVQGGEPRYTIAPGRAYDLIDAGQLPEVSAALLYQGTLVQRQASSREAVAALQAQLGVPIFMDLNLRTPWWSEALVRAQLERSDHVKLNLDELNLIASPQDLASSLESRAQCLLERYALKSLIITQGAAGAFALTSDGERAHIAPQSRVDVVDTVGAGDAFAAVLIVGLLRGWPLEVRLQRAQAFASRIVAQRGATALDPDLYAAQRDAWTPP